MKKLKKRAILSTSVGLASLVISAAGCAYGPAPDVDEHEISSLEESIDEEKSSVGDTNEEIPGGQNMNEPAETVYGPPLG
ncbi:MAG: hypothetical protein J5802_12840 [Butyrivibrio sp.]|nr:hypothetical protein [Butyrivibrio sp.]